MGNHYQLLLETLEGNLTAALKGLGWSEASLAELPKDAPEKMALAAWLRERTTVSLRWAAERLGMGYYTQVNQAVSRLKCRPGWQLRQIKSRLENPAGMEEK